MKYIITVIIVSILLVVFIGIRILISGWHYETTSGEHTGYITAVEKDGIIWKRGFAYVKTDLSSSQEDNYCVIDSEVQSKLLEASKTRQRVTVKFNDYLIRGLRYCGGTTIAIITGVEPAK